MFSNSSIVYGENRSLPEVDDQYDANNCEFYVDGVTVLNGYYMWSWKYLESYISVDMDSLVYDQGEWIKRDEL